jgi:hypothetical protein
MKSNIRHVFSRRWLGVGLSVVTALAAQAQTAVTFSVDMSTETLGTPTAVYVTGTLPGMGWAEFPAAFTLTNVPSTTIWQNTFIDTDPVGTVEQVKFNDNLTGWEPSNNREFLLGTTGTVVPGTEVLPLAVWNSASTWPNPTNQVTFQVDMSAQIFLTNFIPGTGTITVSGDFEGWDNGINMTNNPALSGSASNVYSCVAPVVGFLPDGPINYKFRMNGGWESPASTSGNNRQATIATNPQVLPLVYYNDNSIHDLITGSPINVTFTIYCPNGTLDETGYGFTKGTDAIYINGDWLGWWGWGISPPGADQMVEVGNSDVYTNTFTLPYGNSIYVNYKYSFDGLDNENGFSTNHVREVRSYGPNYTMPQDVFSWSVLQPNNGNPYPLAGLAVTNIVEPDFGNLAVSVPSGGKIPITWLGRPGVILQNSSSLPAVWNNNSLSDATMSTNWLNAGGNQFFRLQKEH